MTLTSLLFGLNNFTSSNSRFSIIVSPGAPYIPYDRLLYQKTPRYAPMFYRELVLIAFAIPLPPSTLMDNYMHLPFLHSSRVGLVITRYPEILRIFRGSFGSAALQLLFLMNTCMNNSSHLPSIRSSPVVHVFHNGLRNTIRSSKKPQ